MTPAGGGRARGDRVGVWAGGNGTYVKIVRRYVLLEPTTLKRTTLVSRRPPSGLRPSLGPDRINVNRS